MELTKQPEAPAPEPVAWITVPARFLALAVVLPVRLVYDLVVAVGRGVWAVCRRVASGLGWLMSALFVRPMRWFYRVVLTPVGHFLSAVAAGLGRAIAWTCNVLVVRPLSLLLSLVFSGVAWVLGYVIVLPAKALWDYALRPLGRAVWQYALRPVWLGSALLARGLAAAVVTTFRGVVAALSWAFDATGRLLRLVYRKLVVGLIWQYALRPVWLGLALLGRVLAAVIVLLVVRPVRAAWRMSRAVARVLVVQPARWVHRTFLAPIRASVRQARLTVMATVRQTSLALRGQFRRAR